VTPIRAGPGADDKEAAASMDVVVDPDATSVKEAADPGECDPGEGGPAPHVGARECGPGESGLVPQV
jgi:hypothetical protein